METLAQYTSASLGWGLVILLFALSVLCLVAEVWPRWRRRRRAAALHKRSPRGEWALVACVLLGVGTVARADRTLYGLSETQDDGKTSGLVINFGLRDVMIGDATGHVTARPLVAADVKFAGDHPLWPGSDLGTVMTSVYETANDAYTGLDGKANLAGGVLALAERPKMSGLYFESLVAGDVDAEQWLGELNSDLQTLSGTVSAHDTKLAGIAVGATANLPNATLLARANHTGTQAANTITGLATVATSGSAADLGAGTLPDARLSSAVVTLTGIQTLTNKSIDAAQLTGTLNNARLAGVGLTASQQDWSGAQTFSANGSGAPLSVRSGAASGSVRIFNVYTSGANNSYTEMVHSGGDFYLQQGVTGAGTIGDLMVVARAGSKVRIGANGAFQVLVNSGSFYPATAGGVTLGTTSSAFGSAYVGNVTMAPAAAPANPASGWTIYTNTATGNLEARNSAGTVRTLALP